ncbi:MAG: hypothetical protein ACK5IB_02635 [Qingshengfaniella sp.]
MKVLKKLSAAAVGLVMTAGAALAVPVMPGSSFSLSGEGLNTIPLQAGATITPTLANDHIAGAAHTFALLDNGTIGISPSNVLTVASGGGVNNGDTFYIDWGTGAGTFSFMISETTYALTEQAGLTRSANLGGTLSVADSSGYYDNTTADWSFTYSSAINTGIGTWTFSVAVPEVPVPAALPMMAGGLVLLGALRRRVKSKA